MHAYDADHLNLGRVVNRPIKSIEVGCEKGGVPPIPGRTEKGDFGELLQGMQFRNA